MNKLRLMGLERKRLILILLFIATTLKGTVAIESIKTSESSGEIKIAPFTYKVDGKSMSCQGNSFKITATKKKEKVKTFELRPSKHGACWVFMPNKLPGRNITELRLFKGDELLKEGSDYLLDKQGALCNAKKDAKPIEVKAEFSFLPERYDSIFLNTKTNKIELLPGVERDIDAEEYIPDTPDNCKRLFNIVATGAKIQIIPCYENLTCLQKGSLDNLKKKLKKGNEIKLLGYGDSITALQQGSVAFTPNGPTRDRFGYFFRYPKDTKSKLMTFDFNDGIGAKHSKAGWNWALVNQLEKDFGVKVKYLNCAIGGTRSDLGKKHGRSPERIKQALETKPDLVVLAFGMNEIGSGATYKNITEIIKQFKAIGSDVIVMGTPQISGTRKGRIEKAWTNTNSILAKVAEEQNCPFIDTRKINLGIKPEHRCSANLLNHPGIHELKIYGNALAETTKYCK